MRLVTQPHDVFAAPHATLLTSMHLLDRPPEAAILHTAGARIGSVAAAGGVLAARETMVASFLPERERCAGGRQARRGRRGWASGALVAVLVLGCALDGAGALRAKRDAEGGGEVCLSRPLATLESS